MSKLALELKKLKFQLVFHEQQLKAHTNGSDCKATLTRDAVLNAMLLRRGPEGSVTATHTP